MHPNDFKEFDAMLGAQETKNQLRQQSDRTLLNHHASLHPAADQNILTNLRRLLATQESSIISLYLPKGQQPNICKISHDMNHAGNAVCLPRVMEQGHPLLFNLWQEHMPTDKDAMNNTCAAGIAVVPGTILMPVKAFDRKGNIIGDGTGHYDMTMKYHDMYPTAIAIAYSVQESDSVPREYHDVGVDYVVTEKEIIRCRGF